MPVRVLSAGISLDELKHEADELLKQHAACSPAAAQRIREFHPRFASAGDETIFAAKLSAGDAQLTIARERGFASWERLERHVTERQVTSPGLAGRLDLKHHERIEDAEFRRAVDLLDAGDVERLRALLAEQPDLARRQVLFEGGNYFRSPTLLEFVAENPIRHGTLPENIVDVARVILEAGPKLEARNEALALVATGSVARECKAQIPLIDLLCDFGAEAESAARIAALMGEHEAVRALLRRGAKVDLPIAAALGDAEAFRGQLEAASAEDRHLALAAAAQFGHVEMVRALLDAGENADRYNPPGGHSHGTPLHQAALAGHEAVVRLLVERGARLDLKDVLWHGTPADWARHEGRVGVEAYLREQMAMRSH